MILCVFLWFILQIVVDLTYYNEAEPLLWIATIAQANCKEIWGIILKGIYFSVGCSVSKLLA